VNPSLFRLLSVRCALGFSGVLGAVLCFLPLTSVIGPESALVLGVLLPPCAAVAALRIARASPGVASAELLVRAVGVAWLLLLLPLALLALNALRVQPCDAWGGLAFVALGPWFSVSLAALLGVLSSLLPSVRLATLLVLALPLCNVGRAIHDFLTTPGIFAFGHLFGFFPGTLYDRQVDLPAAWWTQRLVGSLIGAGLWSFVLSGRAPDTGRLQLARLGQRPLLGGLVLLLAGLVFGLARQSHALGHTTSSRHVAQTLGLVIESPHCRAIVPRELERSEAQRLAEECELRISQHEKRLGVRETERVSAYFFRSTHEKRALMGAARVYIAKPWRREAYLQLSGFPHPVLAHELAHVVARHAASGPFGVPGKLFGLIPEPTLVEGLAVALEPASRDELTPHQWAKAAKAAGVAPALSALLGPSFLAQNQALAYTLAGSFLSYVLDTYGAEKVRRLYSSGDVPGTLGRSFPELERSWDEFLKQLPLPDQAAALARLRFERPGVFSQVCPHLIEQLEGEVGAALGAGDLARARAKCSEVLAIDPNNTGTRASLAGTLAQRGEVVAAAAQLALLGGPTPAPSAVRARAETLVADAAYVRGDFAAAQSAYEQLLARPQPEGDLRQIEVKLLALRAGEPTRSLIAELLIGPLGRPPEARTAMHLIRRMYAAREDGLAPYLEGRQLLAASRHDLARGLLETAFERGLPTRRLVTEAARSAAVAAFVSGALDAAEVYARRLGEGSLASLAEQAESNDFLARIAFRRALLAK
jgi:tetratricopeptide (TPR) repeat protein